MKKTITIILALFVTTAIGYYAYAYIITIGSQRMEVIKVTEELKALEKKIQKETNSNISTFFTPIPKFEIENCQGKLPLNLYVNNDSITQSKKILDNYIFKISERVNKELTNKKCIDSLIIEVSIHHKQEKANSLKHKKYRYSFPVK